MATRRPEQKCPYCAVAPTKHMPCDEDRCKCECNLIRCDDHDLTEGPHHSMACHYFATERDA